MILADLALGAVFGLGAFTAWAARPRPVPLAEAVRLADPVEQSPEAPAPLGGWASRLGARAVPLLTAAGLPGDRARKDLVALSMPAERLLAEQAACAFAGLVGPLALSLLLSWTFPLWLCPLFAAAGVLVPQQSLHARAEQWRLEVMRGLSMFLDVTVVALSGGAGVEGALRQAGRAGAGPVFALFRAALHEAEITRSAVGAPFGQLGERLRVPELVDLASSLALAGTEGAAVRESLSAKAETLRTRLLHRVEAQAGSATERMSLPVVVLFGAFLICVGFPGLADVLQVL